MTDPSSRPTRGIQRLFEDHYVELVRLVGVLIDDRAVCEDVVQDAFVKYLRADPGPRAGKEAAYLRSIAMNGARSVLRRRRLAEQHPETLPDEPETTEAAVVGQLGRDAVIAGLRRLSPRQAEVLLLRYFLDLSEAEIADTLGISPGTVKTHASRGLATLAPLLGDEVDP